MIPSPGRQVLETLRKFWVQVAPEGRVFLAISGGVDSMVLLEGLHRLGGEKRLHVVHVNHSLRGEESDGDESMVRARAAALGIPFTVRALDWSREKPSQNRCRERREAIFRELCAAPSDRVWLAHHLNDQAETLFLRLLRGTGARGLRGMLPVNGIKVRPFLTLEKATLLAAAAEWGVPWREDSSNRSTRYERNWVREIFSLVETRRPGFQGKLAALAEEARGWELASGHGLSVFPSEPGIQFARVFAEPSTKALAEGFSLSRRHAEALARLLGKSSGILQAERAQFTWSAGVLLCERGARFRAGLDEGCAGPLGHWELPADWRVLPRGGESQKKEFQSLRVPRFFRAAIPVVARAGRPVALLPKRLAQMPGVKFTPSPLAAWWLGLG